MLSSKTLRHGVATFFKGVRLRSRKQEEQTEEEQNGLIAILVSEFGVISIGFLCSHFVKASSF